MDRLLRFLVLSLALFAIPTGGTAQLVEYFDCKVEDANSLIAAVSRFHDTMSGGIRPSVSLDETLWNGASSYTHTLIVAHQSYQDMEAASKRIEGNPAAWLQLLKSISTAATCDSEGLAVQLGLWGDSDAEWEYYAVIPITTSDSGRYRAAFAKLAEAHVGQAPGMIQLYQNRAGAAGVTHWVVLFSPSLATLNEYLDRLPQSSDFAAFLDEVRSIRTVGTGIQRRRIMTLEP